MTSDLLNQLQEYGRQLDAEARPLPSARAVPLSPPRRALLQRPWAVAGLAAIATLVLIGAATLLLRSDDTQVTDEPAPSTTMTVTPTERSLVDSFVWSRAPGGQPGMGTTSQFSRTAMDSVVVFGDAVVAVGSASEGSAVWTSTDGLTWSRVPHDDTVFGPGIEAIEFPTHMTDVTVGGPGLVAVGLTGLPEEPKGPPLSAVWVSDDGITWSRTVASEGFEGPTQAVTSGGPGLVSFGFDGVHTSVDGLTWTVGRCPGCPGEQPFGYMLDAIAGGPGLVAVGLYDWTAAVWYSTDGISWSRVPHDEDVFGNEMVEIRSVANGGPGLVAVGFQQVGDDKQIAVVWTSTDGVHWTRVPHDEAVFGDSEMRDVIAFGDGLVAVGAQASASPDRAVVWTSTDGITWTRIPNDDALFVDGRMNSLVAVGDGLVVVGETVDDWAASWTANPQP